MGACCGSQEKPASEPEVEEESEKKIRSKASSSELPSEEESEKEEAPEEPPPSVPSRTPPTSNSKSGSVPEVVEEGVSSEHSSEVDYEQNYVQFSPLLAPKEQSESSYKRKSGDTDATSVSYESNSRYRVVEVDEPKAMDSLGEKIDELIALLSSESEEEQPEEEPEVVEEEPEEAEAEEPEEPEEPEEEEVAETEEEVPETEEKTEEEEVAETEEKTEEETEPIGIDTLTEPSTPYELEETETESEIVAVPVHQEESLTVINKLERPQEHDVKDEQFAMVNLIERDAMESMNLGTPLDQLETYPYDKSATPPPPPPVQQGATTVNTSIVVGSGGQVGVTAQVQVPASSPQPQTLSQVTNDQMSPSELPTAVTILDPNNKPILVLDVSMALGQSGNPNTLRLMNISDWEKFKQQQQEQQPGISLQ